MSVFYGMRESLVKEEYLVVKCVYPVFPRVVAWTDNIVMVDALFQECFMQVVVYFKEEIVISIVDDYVLVIL